MEAPQVPRGAFGRIIRSLCFGGVCLGLPVGAAGDAEALSVFTHYLHDPDAIRRGKMIYRSGCGGYCHASYPQAQSDAPYLFDCQWKNGGEPQQIFDVIAYGVPDTRMVPLLGQIKGGADDIWKIVAFLKKESQCTDNQGDQ